jgi:uncharacterized protein (DUF433 family)
VATRTKSLLGLGIYTVPEAARLTHVAPKRIKRWIEGYDFKRRGEARIAAPLWPREIESDELVLSFRDLLEVRFVDAFRRYGVSWKVIRIAAQHAAEIVQDSHPFSTKKFKTDGRSIFADIVHDTGKAGLLDLHKDQWELKAVVDPFLFEGVEFSKIGIEPVRWWPLGTSRLVVIDPARSFGQPIVDPESIPTTILARAVKAEGSIDAVARWYLVPPKAVRDAVEFENQLS